MRNYCKTIGALAAASALAAGNASAELEGEVHVGYTSEYLFRGLNLGQDLVEAGVDVATEFQGFGVSAGAWYGSVHNGVGVIGKPNESYDELDLYGEVSKDLGFATAAVGYIYYHFQENFYEAAFISPVDAIEQEVYFSLSREFAGFNASLTYFWDIEGDNDGYAELALGKSFPVINECLTLNIDTALGYYVEHSDFAHLTTKVSLDYAFRENAKLSPFIAGSLSLSDSSETLNWGAKNQFVGGVMLSVGF